MGSNDNVVPFNPQHTTAGTVITDLVARGESIEDILVLTVGKDGQPNISMNRMRVSELAWLHALLTDFMLMQLRGDR